MSFLYSLDKPLYLDLKTDLNLLFNINHTVDLVAGIIISPKAFKNRRHIDFTI